MNFALRKKEGFDPQTCAGNIWFIMLYGKAVRGQTLPPQADTSLRPKGGAFKI